MKKKFLITFVIVTALLCLFVFGASAVTIYDDFDVTSLENIEYRENDVVVFDDGFSCPSVYVFKDTKTIGRGEWSSPNGLKNVLDFNYINSKVAPKVYGFDDVDSLDIPQGVTTIGSYACNGLKTIRIISLPDTVISLGGPIFQNASGLEYCIMEHSENSTLTTFPGSMFRDSGLKAFSMPDCITALDSGYEFANCKSLTAVYLSKNLTSIAGSNPCFDYCGKMYLVNEPFVATSEAQTPEEPSIYYFPSNLTTFGASGTFRGSNSINDVLVFGTSYTATTSAVAFQSCPANTVVFLGNMTNVDSAGKYGWGTANFIFANPNDKSENDLNLALKSNQKAFFCYGEGTAYHIKELSKVTDATCTEPKMIADYCFCGSIIGTPITDGEALSHNHTIFVDLVYTSFSENGYYSYKCERCGDINNEISADALFTCLGYSAAKYGDMMSVNYKVNEQAIKDYEKIIGVTVNYGVFATLADNIGDKDLFDENGKVQEGVIVADITNSAFGIFNLKMFGFTEAQKKIDLAMGAFVGTTKDGATNYTYLQIEKPSEGQKYFFASYNDIVALTPSDDEEIAQ